MKERKRKVVFVTLLAALLVSTIAAIECATPQIRIEQKVSINRFQGRDSGGHVVWDIGDLNRIGPGGYAPVKWCVQIEDENIGLKGYYVTFVIDPEKTLSWIDWEALKEEANGPTGYRWDFKDNLKYAIQNTYLLNLMGNLAKDIYNVFSSKQSETLDLDVYLCISSLEPEKWWSTDFLQKLSQENIFGGSIEIPDLEPLSRSGRHSWCIDEGIELAWYQRIRMAGSAARGSILLDKHIYPIPYIIVNRDARIGDTHKIAALICSANPDSMWQWTSFNVISYEECEFIIEKPQVSQTLAIGVFIAFAIGAWYTKLWKKIPKLG